MWYVLDQLIPLQELEPFCIQIPLIWEEWGQAAEEEYVRKLEQWEIKEARRVKRVSRGKRLADGSTEKPAPRPAKPRMHSADADNFLSLAAALKILLARSIELEELPRAQELLQTYLLGFLKVRTYL